jgi:hypothetical protein
VQAQDAGPTLTPEPAAEPTEPPVLIPDTTAENLTPLSQTDDAQSTTGPTPPPEVLTALSETDPYSPTSGAKTISGVPVYYWWNGCGPTAAGMVIGYWDTFYDNRGKDWLIPGNSATQTTAAEEAMASTGTKSHYSDYALPMDETTTYMLLDNSSLLEVGDRHADNSIADFMKTSWSSRYNRYGWSWFSDVVPAMLGYAKLHNPGGYTVTSAATTKMTWAVYQAEINAGHPVVLLVDSNGYGWTDHFITAVGYDTTPSGVLMYAAYDTWNIYSGNDLRWFTFHSIKNGDPWGIYGGVTFKITTALSAVPTLVSPPTNLFTTDANKPNLVWNAAANATAYQLQLSTSATFAGAAIIDVSTNTSYTIPGSLTEGKYYWRVRSQNVSDTYSAWSLSRYFTVDNTAPAAPLLALPLDNTSSIGAPLFSWKASLGAAKYQFAYAATNVFPIGAVADPVSLRVEYASSEDLVAQTFKPLAMTSGDHYWSVRAKDAAGNWSFWSSARKVSITAPIPAAPALNQPQTKSLTGSKIVNLSWYGVPYGVKYRVQVDSSIAFIAPLDFETITPDLKIDTSELLDGVHYWRVQATNVDELVYGKWSLVRYFTVDTTAPAAPSLVLPLDNATPIGAPIFVWKASPGAVRYQFAYNTTDFPTDVVKTPTELGTVYQTGELIPVAHKPLVMTPKILYYWSVRAKDAAGNWGYWSPAHKVTITAPIPAAPALNQPQTKSLTGSKIVNLSWYGVPYGVKYRVQVDSSIAFIAPLDFETITPDLKIDTSELLDGVHYWRVQATNVDELVYGKWSLVRYFTVDTTAPAAPSLVLPLDNATPIGAPIFSWKASLGAAHYQFAYDDASSSFPTDTVIAPRDIVGLEYYTGELITLTHKPLTMTLGDHYWSVRAKDAAGNWGFWSAARKVTILPPTPAAPLLNLPGNASKTDSTSLELSWFAPTYANAYEVQIDDSIKFTSPNYTYTAGVGELSHTFDFGSLAVGTWYWHVRAKNTNNAYSLWSLTRSFTILPSFDTQFNSDNDFEGWVQNPGAAWNVTSGNLTTNGLHDWNTSSASYPATFTDFTYEANIKMNYLFDETWIWNYYGLVVRGTPTFDSWNDWKTTYYFALSQHYDNSHTSVACYQVMKIYNGKWSQLVYNCSNIIKSNDFNDLKVYANGSTLKFYINNTLMWSQTVSGISSGRLGVFSTFGTKQDGITPSLATVYVDWAKAGEPVLSSSALFEEVTPNQWPGELPSPWMNNKGLK